MASDVARLTRRKVALEALSFAVPVSASVLFSGEVVAKWSRDGALTATVLTAIACLAFLLWHRSHHPASVAPWGSSAEAPRHEDADDEEVGGWDAFILLLFVVSLTAVVVAGVVVRFMLPLGIIVLFTVVDSDSDLGDVALATLLTLAVAAVVELGVVIPLSRLWNLSIDEGPGLLASVYPVPTDGP